jgi:oral-facial-digital syndrome 1 protein
VVSREDDRGLLWNLISELLTSCGRPTVDNGIQTDSARYGPVTSLEEQFAKVDAHYTSAQDTQLLRLGAVEERILCYQRQLEERSRTELNMMMARFRETELAQARVMEREQSRREIDNIRREMERNYQAKFDALRDRERQAVEQLQRQQEIAEKETYTQRQTLLEEIEALKQRDIQLRRQHDIDNREKALWEEKLKAREDLARQREETARRTELEYEHRIHDAVEKFKLEERTRYVDRLTNVEFREARIKETERRLEEQLQDVSDVRVELKEKRCQVNELEAELIRTRHELLAVQKQVDLLTEKTRQMVDYHVLKEDNAVLRKELETTKMRLAEVMRDNLVERQKQEELLREMGQQLSKPTPEVALLRQQIDQLHSRHRTELAISDHERLQLQQRLQDEIARNKELVMKCEEQTWQQKQIGLEACDLRERLVDSHHVLSGYLYRQPCDDLDRSGSVCGYSDVLQAGNISPCPDKDSVRPVPHIATSTGYLLEDNSISSDLVQDTKNRLHRLETEAEVLERNYRDFQFRVTNLDPVLDPAAAHRQQLKLQTGAQTDQKWFTTGDTACSGLDRRHEPQIVNAKQSRTDPSSLDLNFKPKVSTLAVISSPAASVGSGQRSSATSHVSQPSAAHQQPSVLPLTDSIPAYQDRTPGHRQAGDSLTDLVHPASTDISRHQSTSSQPSSLEGRETEQPLSVGVTAQGSTVLQGLISLDEAWKTTSAVGPTLAAEVEQEQLRRDVGVREQFEEHQRALQQEERRHQEEENRLREQQELEKLLKQQQNGVDPDSRQHSPQHDNLPTDRHGKNPELATAAEPMIDPQLEKYMAIVQEKKRLEKQEHSPPQSPVISSVEESISVADDNSNTEATPDEKDDFW